MSSQQRLELISNQLSAQPCNALSSDPPKPPHPMEMMAKERQKASFPVRELTYYLDGGKKMTEMRERMMLEFERDPIFRLYDVYDLTKDQIRERTMEKFRNMVNYLSIESVENFQHRMELVSVIDPGFWTRFGVHYGLFFGALRGSASPAQFSHWISKGAMALNGMIGCFAMTELGHGSNVAGLETTATFDEASDQFIIHTPTITATKWWIGGAAHSATHAVVFAQLIVKGKRYGTKSFVVPLRDPKTYQLLPGINIGDIGKKMGRDGIDNGWIQFTHVRIPRSNMLMRHTKVSRGGEVTEPPLAQLAYGALLQGRTAMVNDSGNMSKKALTIAIRYAAIRRQFASKPGELETCLLDYPIHQRRLMPLLALTYAMHFTGRELTKLFNSMVDILETSDPNDPQMHDAIKLLKETHAASAGLKAFCTWSCLSLIEQCRQACGGHGYSAYTGFASMYQDFAVQCTWEGDNTILTLQLGRFLINCYREAIKGNKFSTAVGYLNNLSSLIGKRCPAKRNEDLANFDIIADAWDTVTAQVVRKAGEDFEEALKQNMTSDEAYEHCSQARLYAARIHTQGYLFKQFRDGIRNAPAELAPALGHLCRLYGLYAIDENAGAFLQYQYFTPEQMDYIRKLISTECQAVRDQAIPLIDAFNYTDYVINSPLGRYDGNIYEAYFAHVKRQNPHSEHPYFNKLIKPLLERKVADDDALSADDIDDEDD
ncbi:uncharacterized protein VTP21DRAFT_2332 [Calcarisporiella thermophila]|uniref:uncharacterized protein n=1 Tax=Calcarisporiella thermophila TaxID=911321 RepID=UPI0037427B46